MKLSSDAPELPFLQAIIDNPGAPEYRCAFADWLREQGRDAEAEGQAWLARHGKYPLRKKGGHSGGWWSEGGTKPEYATLPKVFTNWGGENPAEIITPLDSMTAELAFLERSTELHWYDGEPHLEPETT